MSWESKTHRAAKGRLRRWLTAAVKAGRWGLLPGDRVRTEMPLALAGGSVRLWHDHPRWASSYTSTPTSLQLTRLGFWVPYRLDLAVTRPGAVILGIEVVQGFPVTKGKASVLRRLPFPTIELDARWVNAQRRAPDDWSAGVLNVYGG